MDWDAWNDKRFVINFCESEYAVTWFIREFWNSCSGLGMALIGLLGLVTQRYSEPIVKQYFSAVAACGVCTAIAHATDKRILSSLDGTSMIWVAIVGLLGLAETELPPKHQWWISFFAFVFAELFSVMNSFNAVPQTIRSLSFVFVGALNLWILHHIYRKPEQRDLRHLVHKALGFIAAAGICWVGDNVACRTPLGYLQLHAWWHLLSTWALYLVGCFAAVARARAHKRETEIRMLLGGFVPLVWWSPASSDNKGDQGSQQQQQQQHQQAKATKTA